MNEIKDGKNDTVIKFYTCKVCNTTHPIQLNKNLVKGRTKYPFPHIILHSEIQGDALKEFLVMLYIDKDLQIRGAELLLGNEEFFTKDQMIEITSKLMEEIERLRNDNLALVDQLNKLKRRK